MAILLQTLFIGSMLVFTMTRDSHALVFQCVKTNPLASSLSMAQIDEPSVGSTRRSAITEQLKIVGAAFFAGMSAGPVQALDMDAFINAEVRYTHTSFFRSN